MLLFVIAPEVATSTHKDYVILPGASAGPHCTVICQTCITVLLISTTIALCIRHHHLSSDESGRGAAGHGEHRNIAHMKHQHLRFMKIINY